MCAANTGPISTRPSRPGVPHPRHAPFVVLHHQSFSAASILGKNSPPRPPSPISASASGMPDKNPRQYRYCSPSLRGAPPPGPRARRPRRPFQVATSGRTKGPARFSGPAPQIGAGGCRKWVLRVLSLVLAGVAWGQPVARVHHFHVLGDDAGLGRMCCARLGWCRGKAASTWSGPAKGRPERSGWNEPSRAPT